MQILLSGITFSAGGFATLTDLSAEAALPKTSDIPAALPLLFIAGDKDPVGMFGKDVVKAAEAYRRQGSTRSKKFESIQVCAMKS